MVKRAPHTPTQLDVPITALQRAWLQTMGVDVPWIRGVSPGLAPADATPEIRPARVALAEVTAPVEAPAPAPLVRADLAGLTLDQLADQVRQCQHCALCATRRHAVAGQGVSTPDVLVVGEAPGEQEDVEGMPFVGRSGKLLDNMLSAVGHDRSATVYITNVVKCRPPANRNPKDDEIAACRPFLDRQIALLKPKAVLAMGRFAAHTLLKTDASLQNLRQRDWQVSIDGHSIPVVVTYHPAYLLRRPVDKRLAWDDLRRLVSLL